MTPTVGTTPAEEAPATAAWLTRSTDHFDLHYLPDSAAARDIEQLAGWAEAALQEAAAQLRVTPEVHMNIYFANRIFMQGGAAWDRGELLLSYPEADHSYASNDLPTVLRHEIAHALVDQFTPSDQRGGLIGEGVAVWAAGGHYRREPVEVLAATLVGDNTALYVPLSSLQDNFYSAQHEIAYIEGGSFVKYLVQSYGLEQFKIYLSTPHDPQAAYGKGLLALEQEWLAWLDTVPVSGDDVQAVALRVRLFDLMRRYQADRDTDALALTSARPSHWGLKLVARASSPATGSGNAEIENALVQAGSALFAGDLRACAQSLDDASGRLAVANN